MTQYWVTLRYHATGTTHTEAYPSALERALVIIATAGRADVVAQGER